MASAGEDEDQQHQAHREEHRLRVLPRRVLERGDVHGVHLHAGVRQEVVDDQDEAGEARPLREEVRGGHRGGRGVALPEEDHAEDDEQGAGDQGADDQAPAGQSGQRLRTARGDPHAGPVEDHDDDRGVRAAVGEGRIDDVRDGGRDESEQARVVEDRHRELAPHGEESERLRQPLGDPPVHAAVPAGGEFRGDQGSRQQEHDRRDEVEEHTGQAVDGHGGRGPQTRHRRGGHQGERHPGESGRCGPCRRPWPGNVGRCVDAAHGRLPSDHTISSRSIARGLPQVECVRTGDRRSDGRSQTVGVRVKERRYDRGGTPRRRTNWARSTAALPKPTAWAISSTGRSVVSRSSSARLSRRESSHAWGWCPWRRRTGARRSDGSSAPGGPAPRRGAARADAPGPRRGPR